VIEPLPAVSALLPHRGRWLLLDRVAQVDRDGACIEAFARFELAHADGHFPGRPVVPGVLILEALAQAMGYLAALLEPAGDGTPLLAAFDSVRFRAPVVPPAEVRLRVVIRERRMGLTLATGEALVGETSVCTARLTGARS